MTNRMNNNQPTTAPTGGTASGATNNAQGNANQDLARRDESRGLARQGYGYGGGSSPFELMRRFSEDVDRLFGSFGFGNLGWPFESADEGPFGSSRTLANRGTGAANRSWAPAVDMYTRGDDMVIAADLPGLKPEDVTIEAEGNNLILRGESQQERNEQGYYERSYGSFYRTIPLPQGVSADQAQAQFNNGVLEVTLPGAAKQIQPQRRRIAIQGMAGAPGNQAAPAPATPTGGTQMNTSQQNSQGTNSVNG
jgi:HSP20 family protein